eukprot:gene7945-8018_t
MTKNLYLILIVFLGLGIVSGVWNFIFAFHMGAEVAKLDSFVSWFLLSNITSFTGSIFLLKYFYHRNFRGAFFTGSISTLINLCCAVIFYINLTSAALVNYYLPTVLLSVFGTIVFALGLLFSAARKRIWLKLAGIGALALGIILMAVLIERMFVKDAGVVSLLDKILQWSPVAGYLVTFMLMMNLLTEIRELKTDNVKTSRQSFLTGLSTLVAIAAIFFTLRTGKSLIIEARAHVDWSQLNALAAQQLVGLADGAKTFVDKDGDTLHYLLIKPMDYDKQKKYPLVVCLPYGGYEASGAEFLSNDFNRYTYRAFIFVPYCPEGEGWGGISGTPSLAPVVYEAISSLHEPGIDVKRRYITGVSRGGYGTWEFICERPDLFAAAVPVCGGGDPDLASKLVNMPVWAFHGAFDTNVPVSGSRDMIAAIKKAGGHPQYTEYPEGDHNIWEDVSKTPDLLIWLFSQKQK